MMDVLHVCKTKRVYWDAAQTVSSLIRWYWCEPGALPLPFPHRFSSEGFDPVHWYNPGAGEDSQVGYDYDKGAPPSPAPTALHWCGPPLWWEFGAPSDAPPLDRLPNGIPVCCASRGAYSSAYALDYDTVRG